MFICHQMMTGVLNALRYISFCDDNSTFVPRDIVVGVRRVTFLSSDIAVGVRQASFLLSGIVVGRRQLHFCA